MYCKQFHGLNQYQNLDDFINQTDGGEDGGVWRVEENIPDLLSIINIKFMTKEKEEKWNKYNEIFKEYNIIFENKISKNINLDVYDLLLLKNFKGGAATFTQAINEINVNLKEYSGVLFDFYLNRINEEIFISKMFDLLKSNKISGFGTSFLSAMMSLSFPNKFPIMDRRVLIEIGIVKYGIKDKFDYGTTKNKDIYFLMDNFGKKLYLELYEKLSSESRKTNLSMRELDKKYFTANL